MGEGGISRDVRRRGDWDGVAAVVAEGDAELVVIDPVDGVLEEIAAEVAGVVPRDGGGPAGFSVGGGWGVSGEAVEPCGGGAETGFEGLVGGGVLFRRPCFAGGRDGGDDSEGGRPVVGSGIGAEARFEVGWVHRGGGWLLQPAA